MLLAAMLAMALVAASPAMAHTVAVGGDVSGDFDGDGVFDEFDVDDDNDGILDELEFSGDGAVAGDVDLDFVDASQTAAVSVVQTQTGDATATSGDVGSAASAEISNELDVSVEQGGDLDGFLD